MKILIIAAVVVVVLLTLGFALSVRVVKQYQLGVLFGRRVLGPRAPGLRLIIPVVDVLHRVSLRIVTKPIQSQVSPSAWPSTTSFSPSPTPACAGAAGSCWSRGPQPARSPSRSSTPCSMGLGDRLHRGTP